MTRSFACATLALALGACSGQQPGVYDAWVRAAPDGRAMGAAYFTLKNRGPATDLVAVSSDSHSAASIHLSEIKEGIVRMRSQDRVQITADSEVKFEPGGLHIMLMRPLRPLAVGDAVRLSLEFTNGSTIQVAATVRKGPP